MCWSHWRRVPKVLNRAIFDTYAHGPKASYDANVAEAISVIQGKEAAENAVAERVLNGQ